MARKARYNDIPNTALCCLPSRWRYLYSLLFYPEDGNYIFLRNVCCLSPGYIALHRSNVAVSRTE
jgi:hypothetical protein